MSEPKISVTLEIDNIGPHSGINKIKFSDNVNSNKAIFYALNGTGKSFISRTFQLATHNKPDLHADDLLTLGKDSGRFNLKIVNTDRSSDEKRLSIAVEKSGPTKVENDSGFIFHVFNSDYVKQNIEPRGYTPDGNIQGYILGKAQIDLTKEKNREAKLKEEITNIDVRIDEIIENAKEELKQHGIRPNTRELSLIDKEILRKSKVTDEMENVAKFDIIVEQLNKLKELPENLPDIAQPDSDLKNIPINFDEIVTIITTVYPKADWEQEFVSYIKNNRDFIEKGLNLINSDENICPFCKQQLGDAALELIRRYKSFLADKEAKVLREIQRYIKEVENIIEKIHKYVYDVKNANNEIANFKQYFPSLETLSLDIPCSDEKVFDCFHKLISLLQEKSNNISYTDFGVKSIIKECKSFVNKILQQQESNAAIIARVNNTKNNTNAEKLALKRDLCKVQYLKLLGDLSSDFTELETLKEELKQFQHSIAEKEHQVRISKKEKVFETLEYFLNKFFAGKYSIDKENFQIKFFGNNVGQRASRILSDGEKSIVAFCYYLAETHLQVNSENDYDKLFFIIDDPISSMDFHFVYAVAQSLRDIKGYFGITTYDRMWVFTHNLEFYSIIARNHIINHAYIMKPGKIEPLKHQLLMPYENHLKDIVEIASGIQQPSHTTGNSIRHILETVSRFEYPEKSLETYITENEALVNNSCIFTLCQDLSHGPVRNQPPYSDEVIIEACKVVVDFMKSKYEGQIDAIQSKLVNGET